LVHSFCLPLFFLIEGQRWLEGGPVITNTNMT
jgi:hypothetical protein